MCAYMYSDRTPESCWQHVMGRWVASGMCVWALQIPWRQRPYPFTTEWHNWFYKDKYCNKLEPCIHFLHAAPTTGCRSSCREKCGSIQSVYKSHAWACTVHDKDQYITAFGFLTECSKFKRVLLIQVSVIQANCEARMDATYIGHKSSGSKAMALGSLQPYIFGQMVQ